MLMLNQRLRIMITTVFLSLLLWVILGFPIIPLENVEGTYEGHEYFVYERISKTLSEIVLSNSINVSKDDLVNIAIQIMDILRHLFAKKKVLKNLHVNDFSLRRTTKGYRVVLMNQDFFDEWVLF